MKPTDLVLQCYAEKEGDQWQAFYLDFCLAAQGDTLSEAKEKLESMIAEYVYDTLAAQERARRAGFRLQAPNRGAGQPGVGKIGNAVERCHNFFAHFGRVFRRFDRSACHYLAWIEMAACIILLRSGFVS